MISRRLREHWTRSLVLLKLVLILRRDAIFEDFAQSRGCPAGRLAYPLLAQGEEVGL